jgi:hypothetical protein
MVSRLTVPTCDIFEKSEREAELLEGSTNEL